MSMVSERQYISNPMQTRNIGLCPEAEQYLKKYTKLKRVFADNKLHVFLLPQLDDTDKKFGSGIAYPSKTTDSMYNIEVQCQYTVNGVLIIFECLNLEGHRVRKSLWRKADIDFVLSEIRNGK